MKLKLTIATVLLVAIQHCFSQNTIIGNGSVFNSDPTNNLARSSWYRGGNFLGGLAGSNNVFGTLWNSSIYHYTDNAFKMKLNGNYSYSVNGFFGSKNGYLLLGQEQTGTTFFQNNGAFSRLHLHDGNGTFVQQLGYRSWMKNGIYFTGNNDAGYMGQRSNGLDYTDMIITWSDNPGAGLSDNMLFSFTTGDGLAPNTTFFNSGDLAGSGINGREVMRLTANGMIGMGPRFDNANQPTNDLHIRSENSTSSFIQIDNQEGAFTGPTGTNVLNGVVFGMLGNNTALQNGNAYLYNQETRHLCFSTGNTLNPVSTTPGNAFERVRITSVAAPTQLLPSGYGINNPYSRNAQLTYVAISSNPTNAIQRPLSLLHLGQDAPPLGGHRDWMYNGMVVCNNTDQVYIGLKTEGTNREDAIIGWSDDNSTVPGTTPDNLRFIYTQTTFAGSGPGTDNDGLEVARMTPDCPTCPLNRGSMGIGDFSPTSGQGPGNPAAYVGATLDVDGDVIIRSVTQNNSIDKILVWDNSDHFGRLKWRDAATINNVNANNGLYSNNNVVQLGVDCNNPNFGTVYPNQGLNGDRAVNLNGNTLIFDGGGLGNIGVGMAPCTPVTSRFQITAFGPNASGLKFTNLIFSSPTVTLIPGTERYLTVDADGDVILAEGVGSNVTADNGLRMSTSSNVQWGQQAGTLPVNSSQLTFNTEVPMNNFNVAFSKPGGSQAYNTNSLVIGTSNPLVAPLARLEVIRDLSIANVANNNPIGLRVENTDVAQGIPNTGLAAGTVSIMNADNKGNYGGYFLATSPNVNNTSNVGIQGVGQNGISNTGVYGVAIGTTGTTNNFAGSFIANGNATSSSHGILASSINGDINYGGKFFANQGTTNSYGVYTESPSIAGVNYALFVNGDATLVGGIATGFGSDSTIKTNIQDATNVTDLLTQLDVKTFDFNYSSFPSLNLDHNNHYGVIAQDVESVLPNLIGSATIPAVIDSNNNVITPSVTIKTVKYQEFIPMLIAGFNEQQDTIEALDSALVAERERNNQQDSTLANLQQQLNDLAALITNCCGQGGSLQTPNNNTNNNNSTYNVVHSTDVKLSDTYCVLGENSPNPFKDHTVIKYTLSETIQSAQIVFYNTLGQVIKVLEIEDRGEGRLNVYAEDLRSGMYTYSLIVDGNICESKKMIKE